MQSLYSRSDLSPTHPYGSKWGKTANFVFLPYMSFINAFTSYNILRGIGKSYVQSLYS